MPTYTPLLGLSKPSGTDKVNKVREPLNGNMDKIDSAFLNFAKLYDSTKQYKVGECCFYNGLIQLCIYPTTGNYDERHWAHYNVYDFLQLLRNINALPYNSTLSYSEGSYCIYNWQIFRAIQDISPESFNFSHWEGVFIGDVLAEHEDDIYSLQNAKTLYQNDITNQHTLFLILDDEASDMAQSEQRLVKIRTNGCSPFENNSYIGNLICTYKTSGRVDWIVSFHDATGSNVIVQQYNNAASCIDATAKKKLDKVKAQYTFPNLTNASIDPDGSIIMPQGADLNDYTRPGTYVCLSYVDLQTMSNVPPGMGSNFKLFVNFNTGDQNPSWWGCQIAQGSSQTHIRYHDGVNNWSPWQRHSWIIKVDTWAEFIAKAKNYSETTFVFYANATITNKLCGVNNSSFGTCMYSGGYLCWNLTTFNDYTYNGWWKESNDSTKAHIIQMPNGLATIVYEKTGVTIPDNDNFTIDLSSNVPSGWFIYAVHIEVKYNETTWYELPYFNDGLTKGIWVKRVLDNKITLRCSDTGWGSNNRVQIIAHLKKP